ncbi:MAG: hypothetical protein JSR59_00670 [Proteobacteria bacterium]|nr:hypothetical protein [Pseudomonadota bacterium]
MTLQGLFVALIVAGCCVYAAWTLMPSAARRTLAGALSKLTLPAPVARRMAKAATASTGCGCDGCDRSEVTRPAMPAGTRPVAFHRRVGR